MNIYKRVFDLVFASFLIIILSPLLVIISAFVFVDSGFPVLFIQQRVGRGGKLFNMYKFRTMTVLREASKGSFDAGDNSRVTAVGSVLRKSKLDELPQLLNVLFGQMSFVGPRPEVQKWVAVYPERWKKVLSVKPGITDNASIIFRNEEDILKASLNPQDTYKNEVLPHKLSLYEDYVERASFFGDISIIFKTVIAVFSR
jgi:lipopolysaccharide/colanic/teichoic acid biosynthesis glycosyltransferase